MTGLSPLAQRLIAAGLLLLAALLAISALQLLASAPAAALAGLDDARERSARLDALLHRPSPPPAPAIPSAYYFQAMSHPAATALAAARIRAAAGNAGLPFLGLRAGTQVAAIPNLVRVGIAAEGPEPAVLGFVGDLERGTPAVRLRAWRILRPESGAPRVRLEATAVAAWEGPP